MGLVILWIKLSDAKLLHDTGTKSDNQAQHNRKNDTETVLKVTLDVF